MAREWVERPDHSKHAVPSEWELSRQQAEIEDHQRLIDESLGLRAPLKGKRRVPLYQPQPPAVRTRAVRPAPINTAVHEFISEPDGLTTEQLSAEKVKAEDRGALNLECLTRNPADQTLLINTGYRMSGACSKNDSETRQSVMYQRWRLCIRA